MEPRAAGTGTAFALLILGAALSFAGKILVEMKSAHSGTGDLSPSIGLVVAAFGGTVLTWWILSFGLAVAAEAVARSGHRRTARRLSLFTPSFMRRAACVALGVNFVAVPSAYAADSYAAASPETRRIVSGGETSALTPLWAQSSEPVLEPNWRPVAPSASGGLLVKEPRELTRPSHPASPEVVVRPGDSLWSIAARQLSPGASDAAVAESWPRWYEANRVTIGDNPELLQPGQILLPPTT